MSEGTLTAPEPPAAEGEAADRGDRAGASRPDPERADAERPDPERPDEEETAPADPEEARDEAEPQEAEEAGPGPGDALTDEELLQAVTALVYASPDPLSAGRIARLLERPAATRVGAALDELGRRLAASGLPIELRRIAGGWQILTAPALGPVVGRLFQEHKVERISAAALETLAIVAYRQPVTKAEIEAIRGVQAGPILRSLVDRSLVRVTGRADQPGHPLQYGTTRAFLDRFGLGSLEDLPRDGELAEG
jgi:segregation and condensation protein B